MRGAGPLATLVAGALAAGCACRPCGRRPFGAEPPPCVTAPDAALAAEPPDADAAALPREVWDVSSPRAWSVIVVHHSASRVGGAARFDEWHKARGWDGVGYDFVIGNGTDTPDGAVETTFRWREQRDGAHAKGWNDVAIGICLVGNFEEQDPTPAQRDALDRLVRHLRRRFRVPPERVVGHGALGATACPGKRLSLPDLRAKSDPGAPGGAPP